MQRYSWAWNITFPLYSLRWRHNAVYSGQGIKLKLRIAGLCAGNSPGACELPAKMASNAENVFIWWRHHDLQNYIPINALTPAICGSNFDSILLKLEIYNCSLYTLCEIVLVLMHKILINVKSILIQVIASRRQVRSHYLGECWNIVQLYAV